MTLKFTESKTWKRIADLLEARDILIILLGAGSFATAAARFAKSVQAGTLIAVFGSLTAFAAGGLVAISLIALFRKLRYVAGRPRTKLDVFGGLNWTITVNHSGPPVKVRVRVQMAEVGDELNQHFEPFDVNLQTRAHGPALPLIELTAETNLAKATVASMQTLDKTAKQLDIHLPGLGDKFCVVQRGERVFLVMGVTLFVSSPLGVRKTYETQKAIAELDGFHVQERSAKQKKLDAAKS